MVEENKYRLLSVEGIDGGGKTTLIKALEDYISSKGVPVVVIREPGTTKVSESIREILMFSEIDIKTKLLLFLSARADLVYNVLSNYRNQNVVVICDRFIDSTTVYQGYGDNLPLDLILDLNQFVAGNFRPHLTFWLDVEVDEAIKRIGNEDRNETTVFDTKGRDYFKKLQKGYRNLNDYLDRIERIDANYTPEKTLEQCLPHIDRLIGGMQYEE